MTDAHTSDEEVAELVRRTEEAASAYVRGDMDRYVELTHHARGFTLVPPFGGTPVRYENRAESVKDSAGYFKGGEAKLEAVQTHSWDDTIVLVMIERQHTAYGGLPDQDASMRVTHVYRREGSDWLLVHRHADPLVTAMSPEQAAALPRG